MKINNLIRNILRVPVFAVAGMGFLFFDAALSFIDWIIGKRK
jgi:hypothetical protein